MSRTPVRAELDQDRVRSGDPATVDVDSAAFRARTGWAPSIPLARSLGDLLDHWRAQVRVGSPARCLAGSPFGTDGWRARIADAGTFWTLGARLRERRPAEVDRGAGRVRARAS